MLTKIYKKLLLNPLWLAPVISILLILVIVRLMGESNTTGQETGKILSMMLGLFALTLFTTVLRFVLGLLQIKRFKRFLNSLSLPEREALEYDFFQANHIGCLYFTRLGLFIFQLMSGKNKGLALIPYDQIQDVRIMVKGNQERRIEIVRTGSLETHLVECGQSLSPNIIEEIETAIKEVQMRGGIPERKTEEQKREDHKKEIKRTVGGIHDSAVFLAVFTFLHMVGYICLILLVENCRERMDTEAARLTLQETGALMFWPNLFLYIVFAGGLVFLVIYAFWYLFRMLKRQEEGMSIPGRPVKNVARIGALEIMNLTLFGLYTADVKNWEMMLEGFRLMLS